MIEMPSISENLRIVRDRIAKAAVRSARSPSDIKLVAATKDVPAAMIMEAIEAGLTDIGENRVQEAASKFEALKDRSVVWHMIGHLQTNKVKQALKLFSVIQSVDSMKLADAISAGALHEVDVFIEVNTSGEASKFGIVPEAAPEIARHIAGLANMRLTGLMTVGPLTTEESKIRESFRLLRKLSGEIKELNLPQVELKYLSMGMSQDYEIAIEEGSNLVRLGRAIFGVEHKRGG